MNLQNGLHTKEQVTAEIKKFYPWLNGNGYFVFHDTNNPAHLGVKEAIDESVLTSGEWKRYEWLHCNGLTVFRRYKCLS